MMVSFGATFGTTVFERLSLFIGTFALYAMWDFVPWAGFLHK
jgi:hypothetical protein